jgi:hypothetical protein
MWPWTRDEVVVIGAKEFRSLEGSATGQALIHDVDHRDLHQCQIRFFQRGGRDWNPLKFSDLPPSSNSSLRQIHRLLGAWVLAFRRHSPVTAM